MNISPHYRFEGSVFFVYDHQMVQREEDCLEDAIIYFYPHTMPINNQCLLCGQLMGLVQFSDTMFGSSPVLYRFKKEKIAVKHVGQYTFALAGSNIEPDSVLIDQVDHLYSLFAFYHGSVDQVKLDCDNNKDLFLSEMRSLWEQYLAFIRYFGDNLPSVFNPVPYFPTNDLGNPCFLKACHTLQACQRRPQVIAGCILYNRYILCSQLIDSISRCLLLLKPNQNHHPAIPIETDFQLPYGVRIFNVYIHKNDLEQLLMDNKNSPYQATDTSLSTMMRCCGRKSGFRRQRSAPPVVPVSSIRDNGHDSSAASEADPLTSSSGHGSSTGSTLCKTVLEDLILKGLKCCKCVDDEEGELDDRPGDDDSVRDVAWETEKQKDAISEVHETGDSVDLLHDESRSDYEEIDIAEEEKALESEEREVISRQSAVTVEGESGIEVTGSDLHSSTATPFEQRSLSIRDFQSRGSLERGMLEKRAETYSQTAKRLQGMHRDRTGLENRLQETAVGNSKLSGLDYLPVDTREQQGISGDDERPQGISSDGSESEGIVHDRDSAELPDHESGLSRTCYDDHGSVEIPCENLGSHSITSENQESQIISHSKTGSSTVSGDSRELHSESDFHYFEGSQALSRVSKSDVNGEDSDPGTAGPSDEPEPEDLTAFQQIEEEKSKAETDVDDERVSSLKCCEVDGLVHANLFVQAHSEIVLILLTDCDLHQNEDVVKSLWNTSLSELGELDILMRHSSKAYKESSHVPYNYLTYDNFDKTMSGNLKEPVFAVDHVFCDTAKTLHAHFKNAPQLVDVTLRNFHTGIYGGRTLTKEVYFQENMVNPLPSQKHQPQDASSFLEKKVRERLFKDHGLHLV